MNKRINKLFDRAMDEIVPDTWTNLTRDQLNDIKNRFAELIIRECADIASINQFQYDAVGNYVKKHFGVEQDVNETLRNCSTYFGNDI